MFISIAAIVCLPSGFWLRSATHKTDTGFETLAAERQKSILRMSAECAAAIARITSERDGVRAELQASIAAERRSVARVSGLESDLANERKSLGEEL